MTTTIIWTIAILTLLGVVLAVVLYLVAAKFRVEEDSRIDDVEKVLPGANCGGCGNAGCRAFAKSCVETMDLDRNFCPVGGNGTMKKVAAVLGIEVREKAPMVAVVRCNGSCENRPKVNDYGGYASCRVKAALYSGDTGCPFGCLGCGDCVAACQFGAIRMNPDTGLPEVDQDKCTACGACVRACPKSVLALSKTKLNAKGYHPAEVVEPEACIGCKSCLRLGCPAISFDAEAKKANIDRVACAGCGVCAQVCPKKAMGKVGG